ncbi:unnamed protein product [Diatraea saccharalis]|uniref:Galactosyltransferase C-terminal domain-containing protein n=1 Tax=Diatraea saccharalis TaxID=40085 RepID=A0A9N9R3C0_9NEOP|nr:unnamed protein product [Diatraea saccharalis]
MTSILYEQSTDDINLQTATPHYASVIFSNISSDQAYRELVKVGGYHVPQECRPRHKVAILVPFSSAFHTFFGGVSSMTKKQFVRVNGYSNLYWGWGGEDTDMFWRIRGAGFPMVRYQKDIAKYLSLPHNKIEECKNRNELVRTAIARYSYDGLTTLQYKVISLKFLHLYTHILVDVDPVSNKTSK